MRNSKQCFLRPPQVPILYPENGIPSVEFLNNTAGYAGNALYSGWVDLCQIRGYGSIGANVFDSVFHFQEALYDFSTIKHNITAYPGVAFQIPAVAVGQQFGTVPFTVHCRFIPINSSNLSQMKSVQGSQVVGRNCTNLSFSMLSSNRFEDMMLAVDKFNVPCQT